MKKLSPKIHGILDYFTVLFLFISPRLFNMQNTAADLAFVLASVHLLLTIFTDFELGLVKVVPFRIHGIIEFLVSIALVFVSFYFKQTDDATGFIFYLVFAIVLFLVWMFSRYKSPFMHRHMN